jgi:hypothetical protein
MVHSDFHREQRERLYIQHMLERATVNVANVDQAYIVVKGGHAVRPMPTFSPEEISLGKCLGSGGFGIVHEITGFFINDDDEEEIAENRNNNETVSSQQVGSNDSADFTPRNPQEFPDDPSAAQPSIGENALNNATARATEDLVTTQSSADLTMTTEAAEAATTVLEAQPHPPDPQVEPPAVAPTNDESKPLNPSTTMAGKEAGHDIRSKLHDTKLQMAVRAVKNGTGRYALKQLKTRELNEVERTRGMIDLALEAKYLSVVWHPNIIKMRGMARGDLVSPSFFIILDRLYATLDQRMNEWYRERRKLLDENSVCGTMLRCCWGNTRGNDQCLQEMMVERMTVAYDLAAAFFYLHQNRYVKVIRLSFCLIL